MFNSIATGVYRNPADITDNGINTTQLTNDRTADDEEISEDMP